MSKTLSTPHIPHVTIALCTYNGAEYLQAQLDSYLAQSHSAWSLWISDDGSNDDTLKILERFAQLYGNRHPVRILTSPRRGAAANFLSLLCHPEFPIGLTALSDQDDIWKPEKLARAVEKISQHSATRTNICLYGAQSIHVDNTLTPIGASNMAHSIPCFENALVQNIISGHSAVLSKTALELVRKAGSSPQIPYQDWWLYQLVTGAGGHVIVDDEITVLYRQHEGNLMGGHNGWKSSLLRITQVMGHTYRGWLNENTTALQSCANLLTPQAHATLEKFTQEPRTLRNLFQMGIRRQSRSSTLFLYLAAAFRRL